MLRAKKNIGQSITEYATLIAIIVAVIATMKVFLSRVFQKGVTHTVVANLVGETSDLGSTVQWEPSYMRSSLHKTQNSRVVRDINRGGDMSEDSSYNIVVTGTQETLGVNDY